MSNKFTKNTVRIAIQKNGRLSEGSINFLKAYGICFELEGRRLIQSSYCGAVEILLLRSADIAQCVSEGIADFGIVGENVIEEKGLPVKKLRKLGFGECSLVIAVPKMPDLIRTTEDLNDKRIATSYPNLLSEYLKTNNLTSEIIEMSGSVEIAP
ncbi:ATP phosphoribosyltransferase, partial [Patescibacteria group bacterium]|nr:ATP phosphoribosyltransferase [Patescibacteria group bacterium]